MTSCSKTFIQSTGGRDVVGVLPQRNDLQMEAAAWRQNFIDGPLQGESWSKMWQVVQRKNGEEIGVSEPMTYADAYALYRQDAKAINHVNKSGEYTMPNVRISIRPAPPQATTIS